MSPIGVPGPVCVNNSFCSFFSIVGHSPRNGLTYTRRITYTGGRTRVSLTLPSVGPCVNRDRTCRRSGVSLIQLCKADEVAPGSVIKVDTHGLSLAVFNLDGDFYVTDDACTHGPGSLSEGCVDGDIIECNFHQG